MSPSSGFFVNKQKNPAIVGGSSKIDDLQCKVGKGKGSEVTEDCHKVEEKYAIRDDPRRDQYDPKVPPKVLRENIEDGMGCVDRCARLTVGILLSFCDRGS